VKKVQKIVQQEVSVEACDTCGKELDYNVKIDVNWNWSCKYDGCADDYGEFNFCSAECLRRGVAKILQKLEIGDGANHQSLRISASGIGSGGMKDVLRLFAGREPEEGK